MEQSHNDEDSLSPEETLRLINNQQHQTARIIRGPILAYWGVWGIVWLISFGVFFLQQGLNGTPYVQMPVTVPLILLFCLLAAAVIWTIAYSAHTGRHVKGKANTRNLMYGLTWAGSFACVSAVASRFSDRLPTDEQSVLWAGLSVGVTGALYMAGGAIWQEWSLFLMGIWLLVVDVVGISLGPGWHSLLISVAGGGGLLIGGIILHVAGKRSQQ